MAQALMVPHPRGWLCDKLLSFSITLPVQHLIGTNSVYKVCLSHFPLFGENMWQRIKISNSLKRDILMVTAESAY